MPTFVESDTISIQDRVTLMQAYPCFAKLSAEQSQQLAHLMQEVSYAPAEVVVTQEEMVDSVYFIVRGQAEVLLESEFKRKKIQTPVAVLGPEEGIGLNDTGFYSTTGKRTATVRAVDELLLLRIDLKDLHRFLKDNKLEAGMYEAAEQMLRMRLIKQSLPFGGLTHERLQWLSEKVENCFVPAGEILFKQGDRGDKCYLIRSGKIEINAREKDGSSHVLAVLKPPTLFGEATLVTQQPRNANAKALEDSQLLALSYEYLSELWEKEEKVASMFMTLMVDRSRPIRNPKVVEYPRFTADGQTVVILKNPETASYFKLSQEGWFIWQQLSGKQTLMEITMGLANQYHLFSPNLVTALISKLAQANFIQNVSTEKLREEKQSFSGKWAQKIIGLLNYRLIIKTADTWLSLAYSKGLKLIFTRVGQLLLAILTLAGFFAFIGTENHIVNVFRTVHHSWILYFSVIPLMAVTAFFHELGHALGTKFYGREVHSMGIGWYWVTPIAFTDTTDMWLDTRGHRIVVNAAGLYANAFIAGLSSLLILALPLPSSYLQAFLWLFALTTYLKGFAMLNPSQDLDGYYIMMDLFERPYLRRDATAWLIEQAGACFKKPRLFLKYGPELGYWAACIVYLTFTALITLYVQGFVLKLLGMQAPNIFTALLLPVIAVASSSLALISDIREQD